MVWVGWKRVGSHAVCLGKFWGARERDFEANLKETRKWVSG